MPTGTAALSVCGGLAGDANDLCEEFCNARDCPSDPDLACDVLRLTFAHETGTSVFPCEAGAGNECMGDCSGDGEVDISDLTQCVLIVLGDRDPSLCVGVRHEGQPLSIADVVLAVIHALDGCD